MQVIYLDSQDNILIGKINSGENDILVSCDAEYGAFIINLPRVDDANGKKILFKKVDSTANAVTLKAIGEYIENAETYILNEVYSMVQIFATKDKYWILNNTAAQVGAEPAGDLDTHIAKTGTQVHGLGTASTMPSSAFDLAGTSVAAILAHIAALHDGILRLPNGVEIYMSTETRKIFVKWTDGTVDTLLDMTGVI